MVYRRDPHTSSINVVVFVADDLDEVTLIEWPQVIEVWIDREDDATETDCCRLLSAACKEVPLMQL